MIDWKKSRNIMSNRHTSMTRTWHAGRASMDRSTNRILNIKQGITTAPRVLSDAQRSL